MVIQHDSPANAGLHHIVEMPMIQRYARAAGVLFLLSLVFGALGEAIIPAKIVAWNDAAATAHHVIANETLFRWGFATYLVEGVCDTALSLVFYVLLERVDRNLALAAAFFGLIATATFAVCEMFYFAPIFILKGTDAAGAFSPDQLNAFSLLSFRVYARSSQLLLPFYGIATAIRGHLIWRSEYLPRWLGAITLVAGASFIVKGVTAILVPTYSSDYLLLPTFVGIIAMTGWMLTKGVDVAKWQAKAPYPRADSITDRTNSVLPLI
jgi:Domain of unknown function (DUF4386)